MLGAQNRLSGQLSVAPSAGRRIGLCCPERDTGTCVRKQHEVSTYFRLYTHKNIISICMYANGKICTTALCINVMHCVAIIVSRSPRWIGKHIQLPLYTDTDTCKYKGKYAYIQNTTHKMCQYYICTYLYHSMDDT